MSLSTRHFQCKIYDSRYNPNGYLTRSERSNLVLWEASAQDAANRVTSATLGNGFTQSRVYNIYTGRLAQGQLIPNNNPASPARLQEAYQYDAIGKSPYKTKFYICLVSKLAAISDQDVRSK